MHHNYRVGDTVIITQQCFPFATAPVVGTITKVYVSVDDFYEVQPEGYAQVLLLHATDLTPAAPSSDEPPQAPEVP
jgi:hypothetical protein